jgi:protein-S-isoprenylcysteine O-methyltransferase Ste14
MIESIAVTLFPFLFLVLLFGGGALFCRRNIDQDGEAPINKALFYASKYLIVLVWAAMVLQGWGINLSFIKAAGLFRWVALFLWFAGFIVMFIGRLGLGDSFRLGSPRESTCLKEDGLFRFSRNPMYVGVYSTIIASILYTMNPVILVIGIFIAAVHHKIVLAEEQYLEKIFGSEYGDYCRCVRRYF